MPGDPRMSAERQERVLDIAEGQLRCDVRSALFVAQKVDPFSAVAGRIVNYRKEYAAGWQKQKCNVRGRDGACGPERVVSRYYLENVIVVCRL